MTEPDSPLQPPETLENPDKIPRSWTFAVVILILLLAVPVTASWLNALSARTLSQNMIQVMTAAFLLAAVTRPGIHRKITWNPSWKGLMIAMGIGVFYLLGAMLSIKSLYWGSYLVLVAALFWAMFGSRTLYSWLGVFVFSFFLLPDIPVDLKMSISLPLQLLSTNFTTFLAGLLIPITAEGNIFYINGHAYEVTIACSGLHTWIGFMFAGLMWLLFERFSLKALVAILIGAPVLALGLNTVRLFITALVAYWASPETGIAIHTNLEYVLFPMGLILMWLIGKRLYAEN